VKEAAGEAGRACLTSVSQSYIEKRKTNRYKLIYYGRGAERIPMKKTLVIMVLLIMTAGGIFAQGVNSHEAPAAKNGISGQISPLSLGNQMAEGRMTAQTLTLLGIGIQYERRLTPKFSAGGAAYFSSAFHVYSEAGVKGIGRFYPKQDVFFVEMGLGFGLQTGVWLPVLTGLLLEPGIGWKIDAGAPGGFFIEPFVSLPVVLGAYRYRDGSAHFAAGVSVKSSFGIGYAF
jgi:hypothetical protein